MCEENPPNAFRIGGIVLWGGDERDGTAAVPYGGGCGAQFLFPIGTFCTPATPQAANGRQLP